MRIGFLIIVSFLTTPDASTAEESDAIDLSRYEIFSSEETIPTLTDLQDMEDEYKRMIANGNCEDAIPKIIEFYDSANQVSNLVRRGNEPYYDARRDDQEAAARDIRLLNELITAEKTFNNLIRQRNRAWVAEAKCLLEKGERREAITRLYRALDYIGVEERELWQEARTLLWAEVGFSSKK